MSPQPRIKVPSGKLIFEVLQFIYNSCFMILILEIYELPTEVKYG